MKALLNDNNFIMALLGLIPLIIGVYLMQKRKKYKKVGIRAEGTIEDVIYNGEYGYPLVSFELPEGRTVVYKSKIGDSVNVGFRNTSRYNKGQNIPIIYLPNEPENFMIDDKGSNLVAWIFIGAGIVCILIPVYNMV